MTELPPEIVFGKVIGSFIRTAADSADPGSEPDSEPASGTIKFVPQAGHQRVLTPDPVTVSLRGVLCTLDATGTLVDAQGATGLWLATGAYDVVFTLKGMRILPTTIVVTEEHTDLEPLDLAIAIPPEGPPINQGQYAELSHRIENVELATEIPDHGSLPGLADDDHPQYAKSDGTRGSFATVAQGAKADTAVQPAALSAYSLTSHTHTGVYATAAQGAKADTAVQPAALSAYALVGHNHDGTYATAAQGALAATAVQPAALSGYATTTALTNGLATKANTAHSHGVTELTATGTKDATTFLRGDNVWAVPPGGGGGVTAHSALTGLGNDDHTQYAKADGTRGSFATVAQGTKADSAVQPAALSAYSLTSHTHTGVYATAAQGTKADTASQPGHTHGVADLTATGTKNATTFLRGDNTWAVPAGGGGADARVDEMYTYLAGAATQYPWSVSYQYWPGNTVSHVGKVWRCTADEGPVVGAVPGVSLLWEQQEYEKTALTANILQEYFSGIVNSFPNGAYLERWQTDSVPSGNAWYPILLFDTVEWLYTIWYPRVRGQAYSVQWPPVEGVKWGRLDLAGLSARIDALAAGGGSAPADATETVKGIVELATTAEATTGTDTTRATTPAGVKAAITAAGGGGGGGPVTYNAKYGFMKPLPGWGVLSRDLSQSMVANAAYMHWFACGTWTPKSFLVRVLTPAAGALVHLWIYPSDAYGYPSGPAVLDVTAAGGFLCDSSGSKEIFVGNPTIPAGSYVAYIKATAAITLAGTAAVIEAQSSPQDFGPPPFKTSVTATTAPAAATLQPIDGYLSGASNPVNLISWR